MAPGMVPGNRTWRFLVIAILLGATTALYAVQSPDPAAPTQPAPWAAGIETRPVLSPSRPAGPAGREGTPLRRNEGSPLEGWGQTVLALAVVLGIILILRTVLKRLVRPQAASRGGVVEVLARAGVQPRQHLLLVRLGRRLLLLGSSPSGLSTLAVVSDPEEVAELSEAAMGDDLKRLAAGSGRPSRQGAQAAPAGKEGREA